MLLYDIEKFFIVSFSSFNLKPKYNDNNKLIGPAIHIILEKTVDILVTGCPCFLGAVCETFSLRFVFVFNTDGE